jgi:TPR repeat protein
MTVKKDSTTEAKPRLGGAIYVALIAAMVSLLVGADTKSDQQSVGLRTAKTSPKHNNLTPTDLPLATFARADRPDNVARPPRPRPGPQIEPARLNASTASHKHEPTQPSPRSASAQAESANALAKSAPSANPRPAPLALLPSNAKPELRSRIVELATPHAQSGPESAAEDSHAVSPRETTARVDPPDIKAAEVTPVVMDGAKIAALLNPATPATEVPAAAQAPPATQTSIAPILTAQERQSAEKMIARGERDLADGNVALARQFLLRAAKAGLPRGALLLAYTYDPRELARLRAISVQPDLAMARKWYERARDLGAPDVEDRIARLAGN